LRYFLHLSYQGANFHGWQNQKDKISIQEVLETTLSKMLKTRTTIHGCGRTDAGVNASQYICNIDITEPINYDFVFRINKNLPKSIVVYDLIPVADDANAQLDATRRNYDYYCHFNENPFLKDLSTFYDLKDLDFVSMKKASQLLLGNLSFGAFCKSPNFYQNHFMCDITAVNLFVNKSKSRMLFQISGNRFLRGMVRILLANLILVGKGEMSLAEFQHCLDSGENPLHYNVAKPDGLYLSRVEYPFLDITPRENCISFR